ncbi:unnamed protein product [Moneuplotes crassus]|uniref:Uncharacterized protein n=1 Tax=Euplotes crassus TaxID=5936 RepID=A0AAD1XH63_EUPCR|nr:unnamed protein product [Moneuplotes crassus]
MPFFYHLKNFLKDNSLHTSGHFNFMRNNIPCLVRLILRSILV